MKPIKTFVFLDLVPDYDNPTKFVAVNLLTASRSHFLEDVQYKPIGIITSKIQPQFMPSIEPQFMQTLYLQDESDFNERVANIIKAFISQQEPPVCLFSHNGNRFDFPILKLMFENVNVSLSDDVMCADSCLAFYDVKEIEPEFYGNAVRAEFYEGNPRPAASYDLWDLYGRVYKGPDRMMGPDRIMGLNRFMERKKRESVK